MQYYQDTKLFFETNYDELTKIALHILRYPIRHDDLHHTMAGFYIMADRTRLLSRYDPEKSQISVYIYTALKNWLITDVLRVSSRDKCLTELNDKEVSHEDVRPCIDEVRFLNRLIGQERIISRKLSYGLTPLEISQQLHITPAAVSLYRKRIHERWVRYLNK